MACFHFECVLSIFIEDKVWTTVMNNLPPKTIVTGSSRNRRTVLQVNYSASMDQVMHLNTLNIESVLSANKAKVVLYLGLEAKKSFFLKNEKEYIMRWKKGFGFV